MFRIKSFYLAACFYSLLFFALPAQSQNIDIDLLKSINPQYPSAGFWKTTSDSYMVVPGLISFGTLTYAFIANDRDLKHKAYELMIAFGINVVATNGLKVVFNRCRPYEKYPNDIYVLTVSSGHSFPSGHTSLAFAMATSLTLTFKKWYIAVPAYMYAGCMGYSRMYLGRHYPSDVLVGALVGTGSSFVSHWLSKKLFVNKQQDPVIPASL